MSTSPGTGKKRDAVAGHEQSLDPAASIAESMSNEHDSPHNSKDEGTDGNQMNDLQVSGKPSLQSYWRLGTRVRCLTKEQGGLVACDQTEEVRWQWEHRKGFRDYHAAAATRIEAAFQRGEFHVRLRSGKAGETPMELFFLDMIQYDTKTGNRRRIRRMGRMTWKDWWRRHYRMLLRMLETGRTESIVFARYEQRRRELVQILNPKKEASEKCNQSWCATIAQSNLFFVSAMAVVLLNAVWLGIEADHYGPASSLWEAEATVQVMENSFCVFFTLELIVRFLAFKFKSQSIRDAWFVFDSSLVVLMVLETWVIPLGAAITGSAGSLAVGEKFGILRLARILRLTRLGRIVRLLQALPEMLLLLKGIAASLRTLCVTVLLLGILIYVFGVIFKHQSSENSALNAMFPSVPASMWVLLLHGTFMDAPATILNDILAESGWEAALFLFFIFLSSFTVLDMLIGILVNVVQGVSATEKEQMAVGYLKNTLLELLECHDKYDDQHIHKDEFELLMRSPEMHSALTQFGVNVSDLVSLKDLLFEDRGEDAEWDGISGILEDTSEIDAKSWQQGTKALSFLEFLEIVLRLRGGNQATVSDAVEFREYLRQRLDRLEETWSKKLPPSKQQLINSADQPERQEPCSVHLDQALRELEKLQAFQCSLLEQQRAVQQRAEAEHEQLVLEVQKLQGQLGTRILPACRQLQAASAHE
eukprot:TRINITY_DN23605_c0_g1_i1.p1 TRINITY_DN23605_c0_g1~~TRINITY_DN23605_c0_g1_i1.p1  ORF type:complete len:704 (+),score=153.23 TRINITY_DN23605_c0_g1_i1:58-2169(+)